MSDFRKPLIVIFLLGYANYCASQDIFSSIVFGSDPYYVVVDAESPCGMEKICLNDVNTLQIFPPNPTGYISYKDALARADTGSADIYQFAKYECRARTDEYCKDEISIKIPKGYVYCRHRVVMNDFSNARYQTTTHLDHVDLSLYAVGGGALSPWHGRIDLVLEVSSVRESSYVAEDGRCLNPWKWVQRADGKNVGYTMPRECFDPLDSILDKACRVWDNTGTAGIRVRELSPPRNTGIDPLND